FAAFAGGIALHRAVKPVCDAAEQRRAAKGQCQRHESYMHADHGRGGSCAKPEPLRSGYVHCARPHDEGEQYDQMAMTIHRVLPSLTRMLTGTTTRSGRCCMASVLHRSAPAVPWRTDRLGLSASAASVCRPCPTHRARV